MFYRSKNNSNYLVNHYYFLIKILKKKYLHNYTIILHKYKGNKNMEKEI